MILNWRVPELEVQYLGTKFTEIDTIESKEGEIRDETGKGRKALNIGLKRKVKVKQEEAEAETSLIFKKHNSQGASKMIGLTLMKR